MDILQRLNEVKSKYIEVKVFAPLKESFEEALFSNRIKYIFKGLVKVGVLNELLPEFLPSIGLSQKNAHHIFTVDEHILQAVKKAQKCSQVDQKTKTLLLWTMLLHDIGKPAALKLAQKKGKYNFHNHAELGAKMIPHILKRFNFEKSEIRQITKLVYFHEIFIHMKTYNASKIWGTRLSAKNIDPVIKRVGTENFRLLLFVNYFDLMAQSSYLQENKLLLNKCAEDLYNYYIKTH
ncbi:MAG: HD domain-containing protein [Christensenellaceae bacterium]|jgi:tRNA nucleotidyltransferase (CCA-adding enzyme)|nr:HD domain-containing protein [Christensenellaceae bacterium]